MNQPIRLAVLLSGGGTTLQNLIDRRTGDIRLVVASKPTAFGVERARAAGLPVAVVERKAFADVEAFSAAIFQRCRAASVDLVCLAGFLQRLHLPDDFAGRVLNIHPALLPAFGGQGMYGRHVHEAVLAYGAKLSGCTVHFVDRDYDTGPVVLQRAVAVQDDDTPDTLAARVFTAECEAYPEAIRLFAEGRLHIDGRRVHVN